MIFLKLFAPAALLASLLFAAPAFAAEDASQFLLTPTLMQKLKAAEIDMKAAQKPEPEAESGAVQAEPTIEGTIAKLEQDPSTRAILSKHGLSTRELVLASFAMLHAGLYISLEKTVDKRKDAALYQNYTTEQKANIALIRNLVTEKKK